MRDAPFTRQPPWVRFGIGLAAALAIGAVLRECRSDGASPGGPAVVSPANAPAAAPAPTAMAAASGTPAAGATAAVATPPSDDPDPDVGPEGYGPAMRRAADAGDAVAAWRAVGWLRRCHYSEENLGDGIERLQKVPGVPPEVVSGFVQEALRTQRRCQTVTDEHRALGPELAWMAMQAGQVGAAARFVDLAGIELPPDRRSALLAQLKADAAADDRESLLVLALNGWRWGLPREEWQAHVARAATNFRQAGQKEMADAIETGRVGDIPIRPAAAPR